MNRALFRFEVGRLLRQSLWPIAAGVFAVLVWLVATKALFAFTNLICVSLVLGWVGIRRGSKEDADISENEYLLSRTGSRTEFLLSRWASQVLLGALLWVVLTIVLAAAGALSSHSRVSVDWLTAPAFERAGYHAVYWSPAEEERHARWVGAGQPIRIVDGFSISAGRVDVEVPFMAARLMALAFVTFLLGLVSQSVVPPRARSGWRWLREPMHYLRWAPYAVTAVFTVFWPLFVGHSVRLQELPAAFIEVNVNAAIATGLALVAVYAGLAVRSWKRADL